MVDCVCWNNIVWPTFSVKFIDSWPVSKGGRKLLKVFELLALTGNQMHIKFLPLAIALRA